MSFTIGYVNLPIYRTTMAIQVHNALLQYVQSQLGCSQPITALRDHPAFSYILNLVVLSQSQLSVTVLHFLISDSSPSNIPIIFYSSLKAIILVYIFLLQYIPLKCIYRIYTHIQVSYLEVSYFLMAYLYSERRED